MPFATFAAGPYTATYNADTAAGNPPGKGLGPRSLGLVADVRTWRRSYEALPVRAGALGNLVIDGVYRGGLCFCGCTLLEWNAAVRDALWPFGESFGEVGALGRLLSDLSGTLALTAVPGTPAAANGPGTIVFPKAIVAPESQVEIPLGPVERQVPLVWQCFPAVNAAGQVVWFETA